MLASVGRGTEDLAEDAVVGGGEGDGGEEEGEFCDALERSARRTGGKYEVRCFGRSGSVLRLGDGESGRWTACWPTVQESQEELPSLLPCCVPSLVVLMECDDN